MRVRQTGLFAGARTGATPDDLVSDAAEPDSPEVRTVLADMWAAVDERRDRWPD